MYQTLLNLLKYHHNNEILCKNLQSLIFPYSSGPNVNLFTERIYDIRNDNYKKALIINDDIGNVLIFELTIINYNDDVPCQNCDNWINIIASNNCQNYIKTGNKVPTCLFSTCLYCRYHRPIFVINNSIYLCEECITDRKMYESGIVESKFAITFEKESCHDKVWYNIDDISLNLWYKINTSYQRSKLTFLHKLSFTKVTNCVLSYNTRLIMHICNTCNYYYESHIDKCHQCHNILIVRDKIVTDFTTTKLVLFSCFETNNDVKFYISELLIALI